MPKLKGRRRGRWPVTHPPSPESYDYEEAGGRTPVQSRPRDCGGSCVPVEPKHGLGLEAREAGPLTRPGGVVVGTTRYLAKANTLIAVCPTRPISRSPVKLWRETRWRGIGNLRTRPRIHTCTPTSQRHSPPGRAPAEPEPRRLPSPTCRAGRLHKVSSGDKVGGPYAAALGLRAHDSGS